MTFKHINFSDSPVMRSLERLMISKEPEKQESIEKTASNNKPDFTPTEDFFSNLTKLCSGLRDIGLRKYADELENNYLRYKHAQTAYETSKETGEDLVDQAHPKGSVQVGDGEYGVVETIVDQQLKTLKIIDKKPTGKLTSAFDIINAVKISLGQENDDIKVETIEDRENLRDWRSYIAYPILQSIRPKTERAKNVFSKLDIGFPWQLAVNTLNYYKDKTDGAINSLNNYNVTPEIVKNIIGYLNNMKNSTATSFLSKYLSGENENYYEEIRNDTSNIINEALSLAHRALNIISGNNDQEVMSYIKKEQNKGKPIQLEEVSITGSMSEILLNKIKELITKLNAWRIVVNSYENPEDVEIGTNYISGTIKDLNNISDQIKTVSSRDMQEIFPNYQAKIENINGIMSQFYNDWIKP